MEVVDDDFGDLYADVEVQATSAINGVPDTSQLYIQQQHLNNTLSNESLDASHSSKNDSVLGGDERKEKDFGMMVEEENGLGVGSASDSDDEDDFDVVVSDHDFEAKKTAVNGWDCQNVGEDEESEFGEMISEENSMLKNEGRVDGAGTMQNGSGYGGGRGRGHLGKNVCNSQYKFVRQQGSISMGNQRVSSRRGDNEDKSFIQNRRTSLVRGGPSYAGTFSGLSEHGCGFRLPWNRTILDVDVNMFEQRPWTLPGVDITDYFNFGFDEDSWKSYCRSLDNKARAPKEVENGVVNEEFVPNEHRTEVSQESESLMRQFKRQTGRAIHVADSNCERQPYMSAKPPRIRDSDAVIEITVQDMEDSISGKEEPDKILETEHSILEDGCSIEKVKPETAKTTCYESHDMAKKFVEEKIPNASSELRRSFNFREGPSNMVQDSSSRDRHNLKSDALHSGKVDASPRGYSTAVETINNSIEDTDRNSTETNPCVAGIDVLFDDQIQSSPTPSDTYTCSHSSKDWDHYDPRRTQYSKRSSADHFDLRRTQVSRRSSVDSVLERHYKEDYGHVSRESERGDIKMEGRAVKPRSRVRSPSEVDWKRHHEKVRKHSKLSSDNDVDDSYRVGIRRQIYDRSHFSARRRTSKERLHASNFHGDSSYRGKESSLGGYDKRIREDKTACMREFHRWDRWGSRDELDLCSPRQRDEDVFFLKSKVQRTKGKFVENEWYFREKECMTDGKPLFNNRSHSSMKYSIDVEQQNLRRDYDGVCSNRRRRLDLSLEYEYSDSPVPDRYEGNYPLNGKEEEVFDLDIECERRVWHVGREEGTYGREDQYLEAYPLDMDYPRYIRDGEEDWNRKTSLSTCDYLDMHHAYTESRHGFTVSRDDVDDPQLFEKHQRHCRYISHKNGRDNGRLYNHIHTHDGQEMVRYLDEDDYFAKEQNDSWSKGGASWREDAQLNQHFLDDFYDEDDLDCFEGVSTHKWHGTKNEFVHGGSNMRMQSMKHQQGLGRSYGGKSCTTSSEMPSRVEHKKIETWCRNSVELCHVRERKPSQKCSKPTRNAVMNARATSETNIPKQQEKRREVNLKNQEYSSDLEEGQIQTEEPWKEIPKENEGCPRRMSCNQKEAIQNDVNVYNENRILESMAKMEKRRERFKQPVLPKETDPDPKPQVDPVVETAESKQQRPLRKRRWGGS